MKKKWSVSLRVWHWLNALVVISLILTGLALKSSKVLEEIFAKPHVLIGFILCLLIPFRVIRARFFGDNRVLTDAKHYRSQVIVFLREKGLPKTREDFHLFHKAGVKNSYLALYALLAGLALTGLGMVVTYNLGVEPSIRHAIKEVHEAIFVIVAFFVPLHVGGVVYAECTTEPNITSDMIHGGKE